MHWLQEKAVLRLPRQRFLQYSEGSAIFLIACCTVIPNAPPPIADGSKAQTTIICSTRGKWVIFKVAICLLFFAFSTILSWQFFGAVNVKYLFGDFPPIITGGKSIPRLLNTSANALPMELDCTILPIKPNAKIMKMATAKSPHEQGLMAMISVFIDTFIVLNMTVFAVLSIPNAPPPIADGSKAQTTIICSTRGKWVIFKIISILNMTVFAVLSTDALATGKGGIALTQAAFSTVFGEFGDIFYLRNFPHQYYFPPYFLQLATTTPVSANKANALGITIIPLKKPHPMPMHAQQPKVLMNRV